MLLEVKDLTIRYGKQLAVWEIGLTLGERENAKTNRFSIVVKKKVRSVSEEKTGPKPKKPMQEAEKGGARTQKQGPGFWRKVFRRKSV